ncbi:2-oxoglutarate dehydrogenase complex dihydrolipoyllysine-residue succinyltransferase [Olivibacter sitiensis]|uniref:2-oxoglutarate dehydrogenase complex dihydrolipoyllysine-residue succinyltransferase n=1 Tax=Olivibacter sitiensis TaxID=376470 RepID=UPI000407E8FD|nr:2-oxoglutarate dehydrogenase complex dihydrolipoyllysine-residue succinyltransferase [Olivibacter sitiensis]
MGLEIKVPTVGESITEVTLSQWLKKDGDYVEMDENLAELESDKATFELPSEKAGILRIVAQEGDTLEIGAVVCTIEDANEEGSSKKGDNKKEEVKEDANEASSSGDEPAGEPIEIKVPTVGESITEVTLSKWLKQDGDHVEMDEDLAELESDKATFELPAEAAGTLRIIAQEGDTLEIGALVCKIEPTGKGSSSKKASSAEAPSKDSATPAEEKEDSYAAGTPSPAAAKILKEKGIDPTNIKGTGKDGRITKEDALKAEKSAPKKETTTPAAATAPKAESKPSSAVKTSATGERNERREKMSSLRKTIAKRLVAVKNETAMLTTFNEVDMKPIMDLRNKYKDKFKDKFGIGLGFMSFFTKAVTMALQEWPAVNARIEENEIVYSDFVDVSVAVSSPRGLVVPVVRNAESLPLDGIEKAIKELATKARDNKLTIEEMTGGTFTITNGGVFGSMMSTPIINAPQSAILGMHNIVERPVAVNGEVVIRPMMYIALSYDHRIVDGRESVSFLVRVKELLEDPARLLLGV